MKKTFLTMLIVGSCALLSAQEVAPLEPAFDATVGYTDSIDLRGLSYGGNGVVTGIHESQSHFSLFASKGWNWDKWAIKAKAGVRKHQLSNPAIYDSVAVETSLTLSEDPIGITNWVKPSVSVWKDTDYDYSGVTWGLHNTWLWDVLGHQWHITPAIQWGAAGKMKTTGDYDYTKATLRVATEVNVFGQTWEPSVKLTYLDNDLHGDLGFASESETSVWAGIKYRF